MREITEKEARNNLVRFQDGRIGMTASGFGIDIGSGLPKNTRLVFFGFFKDANSVKFDILLLDESSPLITIRKISFEELTAHEKRMWDIMRQSGIIG